jgi:restriction system protein
VRTRIAERLAIGEEEQSELLPSGVQTRFDNQVHWARFYLAKAGFIDSSKRGVWTLTKKAGELDALSSKWAIDTFRAVHSEFREETDGGSDGDESEDPPEANYRERVLEVLRGLPSNGFERFCQRLLRESGFEEVQVTGRSGDGGIDGIGILQVNPLVGFKVLFQCKRYSGSVAASQIRDFRGAMLGRADKGIVLTTGTFTADAKREAIRDGVPPIELVDADKLIGMLENLELGLKPLRTFRVDTTFFDEFRDADQQAASVVDASGRAE